MKTLFWLGMSCIVCSVVTASPYFLIDSFDEWERALAAPLFENRIGPLDPLLWPLHYEPWFGPDIEGEPYLFGEPVEFVPCAPFTGQLYVYEGPEYGQEDPGLVMAWECDQAQEGNYASAWSFSYGEDPDLSNSIVQVTANPPPPPAGAPPGAGITAISFAFVDINGLRRVWWWSVPAMIPYGVPTQVRIDGSMIGTGATNPPATGYANTPGFDITQVVSFDVDENFNYIFGTVLVPPPGQPQFVGAWNYWHNLLVTSKSTKTYKGNYVKFSQPPVVLNPDEVPPMISGWDVYSILPYNFDNGVEIRMAADDWLCADDRPVTDIHWWGSFIGWTQPTLPPQVPDYFYLCIWRDNPAGFAYPWSSPDLLLWEHKCYKWVWNFAGYDEDPRWGIEYNIELYDRPRKNEACFQFNQLLSEDEYFYQEPMADGTPNTYWLSIAAVYEGVPIDQIEYPWGWKTRPYDPDKAPDAAGVIRKLDPGTPPWILGSTKVVDFFPIIFPDPAVYPEGQWFDLAFELTTNEKPACHGLPADLNHDCLVNLPDLAMFAQQWLMTE